jgi:hypothetical protein
MRLLVMWLLMLGLLVGQASAIFEANRSSYLNFIIPKSLHKDNGTSYDHQPAYFGSHYGIHAMDGSMTHSVYYTGHTLCNTNFTSLGRETPKPPFILMINRGSCQFVTKVRHAQMLGAAAVILADNKQETPLPTLSDDGSGHDISIPSMMMTKQDADAVKDAILQKHQSIVATMAWHWPKQETTVKIDYWHTPVQESSAEFLSNFSMIALQLTTTDHHRLEFTPHYHILDGTALHCNGNTNKEGDSCYQLCTNNGRYCAAGYHGVTGQKVVTESLRRMCILKHYPTTTTGQQQQQQQQQHVWWDYLDHFTQWCMAKDDEYFADPDCLVDAFKNSGIEQELIETCMKDSGDITSDVPNSLLTSSLDTTEDYGIIQTPTVLINEAPLRYQQLTPKSVFDIYCTGFVYGKAPHACYQCGVCGDPVACISRTPMQCFADDGKEQEDIPASGSSTKKKKKSHFWKWFFVLTLMGGVGGFVYYKKYVEDGDGGGAYALTDALLSDST